MIFLQVKQYSDEHCAIKDKRSVFSFLKENDLADWYLTTLSTILGHIVAEDFIEVGFSSLRRR